MQILQEKNKNESLESYTSTVSHEFRTPIGTSLMFLDKLQKSDDLGDEAKATIRLVMQKLNLLLSVVRDVLDPKLIEHGKFSTVKETFNPLDVLKFTQTMF